MGLHAEAAVRAASGWAVQACSMKYLSIVALAVVALLSAAMAQGAARDVARDRADQQAASKALARGEILPIIRVLGIATARVPGDVLKVKLERKSFGFQYEVKILAHNGRVREIEIDARTGAVRSIEDD
jgi:uncharacterized membrane protein YkoI